jgi:DMSO/TMAO reductase YedYZ molybdopterin-dependent catalytic subunit
MVALEMLGALVTHDHGGPVRMYAGSMYGYKSIKWLSGIELAETETPGNSNLDDGVHPDRRCPLQRLDRRARRTSPPH